MQHAGDARRVRRDAAGEHRRRRLLRHPAAARRPARARARRRRRQGQPGGAADGAAARDAAHARRRGPRDGAARRAAERAGRCGTARRRASSRSSSASTIRATAGCEFVNAGHLPPLLRRADGRIERVGEIDGGGLALGMFDRRDVRDAARSSIAPGDLLVLYSDGITEAENAGRRCRSTKPASHRSWRLRAGDDPKRIGRADSAKPSRRTPATSASPTI